MELKQRFRRRAASCSDAKSDTAANEGAGVVVIRTLFFFFFYWLESSRHCLLSVNVSSGEVIKLVSGAFLSFSVHTEYMRCVEDFSRLCVWEKKSFKLSGFGRQGDLFIRGTLINELLHNPG